MRLGDELLAKDKRRLSKRRGIVAAAWVAGGIALAGLGYYLYRKFWYDRPPAAGETKDWSGCLEPPSWVQPRPGYSCGQHVTTAALQNVYEPGSGISEAGADGYITERTWAGGMWTYSVTGNDNYLEESWLRPA